MCANEQRMVAIENPTNLLDMEALNMSIFHILDLLVQVNLSEYMNKKVNFIYMESPHYS